MMAGYGGYGGGGQQGNNNNNNNAGGYGGYGGYGGGQQPQGQGQGQYGQFGGVQGQQPFQAGGFVAGPAASASNPFGSPTTDSPGAKKRTGTQNQSLRPVTIRHLANITQLTPDTPSKLDGQEITQVTLVGRLNSIKMTSTSCIYLVDDGTGLMECKKFFGSPDEGDEAMTPTDTQEGVYVRVFGQCRMVSSKRIVAVYKIVPVESVNEITYHCLEALLAHTALTKGLPTPDAPAGGMQGAGAQPGFGMQQQNMYGMPSAPYGQPQGMPPAGFNQSPYAMQTGDASRAGVNDLFSPLQSQIMGILRQSQHTVEGGSLTDVIHRLRGVASDADIRGAVDWLTSEGHLYSTLDEDHYKATGADA